MKIAIITIHFGINYGSALQVYALSRFLQSKGHDVEVINYIPDRYSIKNRYIDGYDVNKLLHSVIAFPFRLWYQIIFDRFLRTNLHLTPKYSKLEELFKYCGDKDVYIAGSDQIWNSDYNERIDGAYYLEFAPKSAKKLAYAGSFGKSQLNTSEIEETRRLLKNFDYISVREKQAKEIINSLGFNNVTHVLDPTFLIDKAGWMIFNKKTVKRKPYVLVYALDKEEKCLIKHAKKIAKKLGLDVIIVCFRHVRIKYPGLDRCLIHQSPNEFVNLLINADYIVTNSFHGLAFAINLNKQFIAVRRKNYNSRLESLLELVGLQNRMISEELNETLITQNIDYNECNNILKMERDKASRFIADTIGESV